MLSRRFQRKHPIRFQFLFFILILSRNSQRPMSSTMKGAGRSGLRSNPEDMMWQGVRSKAPNLMNNQQQTATGSGTQHQQTDYKYAMPSVSGEQSVYNSTSMAYQQTSALDKTRNSMLAGSINNESNFPINSALNRKNLSLAQPVSTLQAQQYATIVGSDDSIRGGRSQYTTESRKSTTTKQQLKKVDYTDISIAMVQQQQKLGAIKASRGQSLRASRFTDNANADTIEQQLNQQHGNARFSSIDVNFKRQIDSVKQTRAQSQLPANMAFQDDTTTPIRVGKVGAGLAALQHNDSIYQSSVNQSMNSGLGLTPKRLIDNRYEQSAAVANNRKAAPFGTQTEQKAYGNRVPPILLANENKMKYMGHKHQTQVMQQADFQPGATPNHQNNHNHNQNFNHSQQMSPRGGGAAHPATANGASFLSRDPGSTAYSQPEDSMFQPSEGSMSQQRSRFPPNVLPKIGSANPEMNHRFKGGTTAFPNARSRDVSEDQMRGRQLSTAQPKNGFKFAKSHVQSQQQRSRMNNQYNDTGFNWKKVDIRTNTNFDGSGVTSGKPLGAISNSIQVPQGYHKPKFSPGQLLDMMQQVDHRGPISHKIVSSAEFERLAQQNAENDGGKPMVEKTIFIVKPIYVPVEVPTVNTKSEVASTGNQLKEQLAGNFPLTGKKKIKVKNKVQKAIYMERPKPPNYTNSQSSALDPPVKPANKKLLQAANSKSNKKKQLQHQSPQQQQPATISSRSPSPFPAVRKSQFANDSLNQNSVDAVATMNNAGTQQQLLPQKDQLTPYSQKEGQTDQEDLCSRSSRSKTRSKQKQKTKKDLKHILESSTAVIDQIFQKRQNKIEAEKKKEADKKARQEAEYQEVLEANNSLKDSLKGQSTTQKSKNTLHNQLSAKTSTLNPTTGADDKSSTGKPVDTTKEFLNTINDQLHMAGAGIQIIMEESKNARWFIKQQKDQQRVNKKYGHVRKWEVAPKTFQETELDPGALNAAKMASMKKSGQNSQANGLKSAADVRDSIPQFQNSPSGGGLSERRWKSPTQQSMQESEALRHGASLSPADESKSPFTARSGRGSVGAQRNSKQQQVIKLQDKKNNNQLSLERVEAMKLMTNKLRKVAKMPVEVENKFCSHLDPGTSAQLIAADDLAKMDQNGKYYNRWRDKPHRTVGNGYHDVPRHFYDNFKSSLIRDAHYMAKQIIEQNNNRSASPLHKTKSCLGTGANCMTISCQCKPKKQKISLKYKFRSFQGGVRSAKRSKNVTKTSYDLYKPYRPCRRTCCANHNPLFHAQRMQQEHLQRMHASATKLMIMSVIPERPISADSATRALRQYQKDIDYFSTTMHDEAKEKKKTRMQRLGSKETRRTLSIEGIEERGANEEEDHQKSRGTINSVNLSKQFIGSSMNFTDSKNMLMRTKLEGSFMVDDALSLTAIECKYLLSVLKNRAIQANNIKENHFDKIYSKARATLKIQMKKLLLRKQFYMIDKQYKLAENEKQTAENLIKVLARCLRMFEAQNEIYKIINLIDQRLQKLRQLRKEQQRDEPNGEIMKRLYEDLLRDTARTLTEIRTLKSIEKTLSRPFMFNGIMYDGDFMPNQMKRKRLQILMQLPYLGESRELCRFMCPDGTIRSLHEVQREQTELEENEALWSESEDDMDEDDDYFEEERFKTINRLNTSSNDKLDKLLSPELKRRQTTTL